MGRKRWVDARSLPPHPSPLPWGEGASWAAPVFWSHLFSLVKVGERWDVVERVPTDATSRLLPEAMEFRQGFLWNVEAVPLWAAHLDDVPPGAGGGFAEAENLFVKIALEGFVF